MHNTQIKTSSPVELCLALVRTSAALTRHIDGRLGSWHGISFADFAVLLELHHAPGGRMRRVDLAAAVGLTQSGVTRALIPLEKIGLISRKPDPNDARVGYAVLTAVGRRRVEEALETVEMISAENVAAVNDPDALTGALERIEAAVR